METLRVYRTPILTLDPDAKAGGGMVEVVKAADAQATIAALQAERDEYKTMYACPTGETYDNPIADLKAHLAQRTAELARACESEKSMERTVRIEEAASRVVIASLHAELERVRAERDRLALCGHDHSTQWWQVRYEDLASLVAALPKEPYSLEFARHTSFYEPLQALTQHRQGMEG